MSDFTLFGCIILFVVSIIYVVAPPQERNHWYGYRTPAAMKSDDNWLIANKIASRLFVVLTVLMTLLILLNEKLKFMKNADLFISSFLGGMGLILTYVEIRLYRKAKSDKAHL